MILKSNARGYSVESTRHLPSPRDNDHVTEI